MATKGSNATEPVDVSAVSQETGKKPSAADLKASGYTIPADWEKLEAGEPVETVTAKPLSEINADADKAQAESDTANLSATVRGGEHIPATGAEAQPTNANAAAKSAAKSHKK